MADFRALNRVKRFVLYGTEAPLCRCEKVLNVIQQKLTLKNCPTLVGLILSGDGAARALNHVVNVVKSFQVSAATPHCSYNKAAACLALVLIIKSQHSTPNVKRDAYLCLHLVCRTSEDLFLFHHYYCYVINALLVGNAAAKSANGTDDDAPDRSDAVEDEDYDAEDEDAGVVVQIERKRRKGGVCGGMKRFVTKWYNDRDPLSLAIDCTGSVHRFGQTHAAIIKTYHAKAKTKALEIVFACLGVRGVLHKRKTKKSMVEIVDDFEKDSSSYDDKAKEVLNYCKKLSQLYLLLRDEEGEKPNEAKQDRLNGTKAVRAAAILKEIRVPILMGVPCEFWHSPTVMEALIPKMTVRDVLHNLPRLSVCKMASSFPSIIVDPLEYLYDRERLATERVDPFEVVAALRRFECGKYRDVTSLAPSVKKRKVATETWPVTSQAVEALCRSFDIALELQPAFPAKKVLIAVDVERTNREKRVCGGLVGMTAESAIGLMVSILMNACRGKQEAEEGKKIEVVIGKGYDVVAISQKEMKREVREGSTAATTDDKAAPVRAAEGSNAALWVPTYPKIELQPKDSPANIIQKMGQFVSGSVDVSALLNHCVEDGLRYDAFIVLAGDLSTPNPPNGPSDALTSYRKKMGVESAKVVVVGVGAKMFTIADPDDPNSLDVLGLSASCVHQIRDFLAE